MSNGRIAIALMLAAACGERQDLGSNIDGGHGGSGADGGGSDGPAPRPLTWTVESTPTPYTLGAMWGARADDVYVGDALGRVLHTTDGQQWTQIGQIPDQMFINGMWGSASDDIYVVGYTAVQSTGTTTEAIAHSIDHGVTWNAPTTPLATGGFFALWGSGANDLYAVGAYGRILHSTDGEHWTAQASGTTKHLSAVWGSGPTDVYVAGDQTLLHSGDGGQSWHPIATDFEITGLWGSGPSDIYAAAAPRTGDPHSYIVHSTDGLAWTTLLTDPADELQGVWGSGPDDVYVAGWVPNQTKYSLFHSIDRGASWTPLGGGLPTQLVLGVWGTSATDVYMFGDTGTIVHGHL